MDRDRRPLPVMSIFLSVVLLPILTCRDAAHVDRSQAKAKICVAQYVNHPALDQVMEGFREEAGRIGISEDQINFHNANGDRNAADILASQLCSDECAAIFVLATPMAQSVKARCSTEVPIIFGAITDPKSANLVETMERPGGNLTGTSDQWPYEMQMELIAKAWGKGTRVGVPFNPAEANTAYAMEQTRSAAQAAGVKLVEVPVNSLIEATQAVDALAGRVDVIYIPADNTVMAAARGLISAADRKNLPVVAGDPGTFESGASIGLGVSYKNLGTVNAQQMAKILAGTSPSQIPVATSNKPELFVSNERASKFGIDVENIERWYDQATSKGN